jgi:AcrR family transcriptional regulator
VGEANDNRRRQILDAALALADEHGLRAVSMRALANRLGLTSMALYPHIGGKEGLLDGLVDRLLAELMPAAVASGDPETRLFGIARAARTLARSHPSAYPLLLSRPAVAPDAVRVVDALYSVLLDVGVPPDQVPRVERLLSTFVLGYATSEVNGRFEAGTVNPQARRGQFAPEEVPAHTALAAVLDAAPDLHAEFEADLADLLFMIKQRWARLA